MKASTLLIPLSLFAACSSKAQNTSSDSSIAGVWKGTSICQVKNSPCHDETVVYYITKSPGLDSFAVDAYKIINGKEEDMGIIHFKFDSKNSQLRSTDYNSLWTFNIKGRDLNGTLYTKGQLYRIIKLTKGK